MKLIVGLGNPGRKYQGTRHNIGFEVIANLANRHSVGRPRSKFNAEIAEIKIDAGIGGEIGGEKTLLMSPLTFMNLSGQSIRAAFDFYKLELTDLLVICDDWALPVGRLRIKPAGSAGGQKGLADTIGRLGSNQFSRLRVGIGSPPPEWEAANYVLGQFDEFEKPEIESVIERAADASEAWVRNGVQAVMNQFNADPNADPKAEKKNASKSKKTGDA
jgi:PTH1 family peptidyl-tRNA hydrolase